MALHCPQFSNPPSAIDEAKSQNGTLLLPRNAITACSPSAADAPPWSQQQHPTPLVEAAHSGSGMQAGGHLDLGSHYMGEFAFDDTGHIPMSLQDGSLPIMPHLMDDDYSYGDQFFDVASQYGSTTNSPLQNEPFFTSHQVTWPTLGAQAEPDASASMLHAQAAHLGGSMPLTPVGMSHFEAPIQYYSAAHRQWKSSGSTSPSQASSVTGTLSSATTTLMGLSRHTSIASLSPLANVKNNPFDATLIDTVLEQPTPVPASVAGQKHARKPGDLVMEQKGIKAMAVRGTKDKQRTVTTKAAMITIPDASSAQPSPAEPHHPSSPWPAAATTIITAMRPDYASTATAIPRPAMLSLLPQEPPPTNTEPKPAVPPPPPPPLPKPDVQRQRNRKAATKCRAKTKKAAVELELKERALTSEHMELSRTVKELRAEVLALKSELLAHGNCESEVIQQYLQKAAREIGAGSSSASSASGRSPAAAAAAAALSKRMPGLESLSSP